MLYYVGRRVQILKNQLLKYVKEGMIINVFVLEEEFDNGVKFEFEKFLEKGYGKFLYGSRDEKGMNR